MDLDADYASTDIWYRDKNSTNKKDAAIPANNGARKKVGATKSVDATPRDENSVSVECVKQMSKEKIRRIGQHLSGSKGKCSVVLLCWIIIVV